MYFFSPAVITLVLFCRSGDFSSCKRSNDEQDDMYMRSIQEKKLLPTTATLEWWYFFLYEQRTHKTMIVERALSPTKESHKVF